MVEVDDLCCVRVELADLLSGNAGVLGDVVVRVEECEVRLRVLESRFEFCG